MDLRVPRRPDQQAWTLLLNPSPLPARSGKHPPAGNCVAPGVTAEMKPTRAALLDPPPRADTFLVVPRAEAQGPRASLPAPTCCVCLPISTYPGVFYTPTWRVPPGAVQGRKEKEMQRDEGESEAPEGCQRNREERRTEWPKRRSLAARPQK